MTDELKSWTIVIVQTALIVMLCPDPTNLFSRASNFQYIVFVLAIVFTLSPFERSGVQVFVENKGMDSWKRYRGFLYFYYCILLFFLVNQIGYFIKLML